LLVFLLATVWTIGGPRDGLIAATNGSAFDLRQGQTWTNSLGMVFRPTTNGPVLFSIWETRVRDYAVFVESSGYQAEPLTTRLPNGAARTRDWQHPGFEQGAEHPVVLVSWEDAQVFCGWLTKHERELKRLRADESYRLPTDAEWSQAIGPAKYPWPAVPTAAPLKSGALGSTDQDQDDRHWFPPPPGVGNYAGTEIQQHEFLHQLVRNYTDGFIHTAPVGRFTPNANGLYDLSGNVAEFCQDWFRQEMNRPELRPKLPFYSNDGGGHTYRVVRGASFIDSHPGVLRSDCRFFEFPDHRGDNLGFRVVLSKSLLPAPSP
jgi:formylglycine-generating enzyme required for sulfatase activity